MFIIVLFVGKVDTQVKVEAEVLVLLSGGIDSAACLDFYLGLGRKPCALFVGYGQPAESHEEWAARAMADHYKIPISCPRWTGVKTKGSGLISGRNAFLVAAALMERPSSVSMIASGIHAGTDYADCSAGFVDGMQAILDIYSEGVQLAVPFLDWSKAEVFEYCLRREVPLELTYSCEAGSSPPCGRCLSCMDREALDASA